MLPILVGENTPTDARAHKKAKQPQPAEYRHGPIQSANISTMNETRRGMQSRREQEIVTNLGISEFFRLQAFGYFPGSGQAIAEPSFLAFSKSARRSCFIATNCG